ncbi:proline-rich receptor-like protein kinase PERK12 [Lathyrus oleraceus]|uniref:proline-rich receptor-like protein kinase PERK12 n=1 Tax=Pisum sativum TaxID=3888 RepID=UPI0021D08752|nr:proline-rich receptor-like protein kinase PERK12 [Pisum sativum]
MRKPSERKSKKKTLKLGEPFETRPPVPLVSSTSSKLVPSNTLLHSNLKQLSSSLPQPSSTYTNYEPITSTSNPSEPHNSNPPSPPLQPFNLTTTTLPVSKALLFNAPISPPSSTPSSTPYYDISSDSDQPEPTDPPSLTLAQLQANILSNQNPFEPETAIPSPSEHPTTPQSEPQPISTYELPTEPPSEDPITQTSNSPTETNPTPPETILPASDPEPTFPTLEAAVALFSESLAEKLRSMSENTKLSDNPSEVRIH